MVVKTAVSKVRGARGTKKEAAQQDAKAKAPAVVSVPFAPLVAPSPRPATSVEAAPTAFDAADFRATVLAQCRANSHAVGFNLACVAHVVDAMRVVGELEAAGEGEYTVAMLGSRVEVTRVR